MPSESLWLVGSSRCGKTAHLIEVLQRWTPATDPVARSVLVFAANGDNRIALADRIAFATQGRTPVYVTTPLGFFDNEVRLFWTLLAEKQNLRVQFPLRLRPETEQMLATQLWETELAEAQLQGMGGSRYRQVRRSLDVLQLAAAAGIPPEDIAQRLADGLSEDTELNQDWHLLQDALLRWRDWCLQRGLLTYGLIFELYWRHLLPDPIYQNQLQRRFLGVAADDVDEYPAVSRHLFETLLDLDLPGAFSFNPDGRVRLGLNADPNYLEGLAGRCQMVDLQPSPRPGLAGTLGDRLVHLALDPTYLMQLPPSVPSLQTVARSQLLRQVAEFIVQAIENEEVTPEDIAIIAPGLDAIARYTLTRILDHRGIPVRSLNVQRPLVSNPRVRSILTLLAFVYPDLGRTLNRDLVAEMLVMLSLKLALPAEVPAIDPVRAGAISDVCYRPDPQRPQLLPAETFDRWDRLGFRATEAYEKIRTWIDETRVQLEQRLPTSPVIIVDRIIREFFWYRDLADDQLEALRELMETASHFWEVRQRVQTEGHLSLGVGEFIALLQQGTVSANPYPLRDRQVPAVTLSTIYQYRVSRLSHRWHFWLDISSPLWLSGGAAQLFAAPIFERSRDRFPYTADDKEQDDAARLKRILYDLLSRVEERVVLCHSDLAANGQEQTGLLLTLANASVSVNEMALQTGDESPNR